MDQNMKKIISEYNNKKGLYADYSTAIHRLLENILRGGKYKYLINSRIKDVKSLKEKIILKRKKGKVYRELNDIEDVAGIRVVFFLEKDRIDFVKKLQKEFGEKLVLTETSKLSGYSATHGIVCFGPERTKLTEYARFVDLKCEIQLTLILNHAWAEVEHDILYKEDLGINKLDRQQYTILKARLETVMKNYIKEASCELERIVLQINEIKNKPRQLY